MKLFKEIAFFLTIGLFLGSAVFSVAQAQPTVPTLTGVTAASSCAIQLDWNQPDSADSFDFDVNVDGSGFTGSWSDIPRTGYPLEPLPSDSQTFSGSGGFIYTFTELLPNYSVEYKIRSCPTIGDCNDGSAPEGPALLPSLNTSPDPPTNLQSIGWSGDYSNPVTLTWTPSAEPLFSGFRISRSEYSAGSWGVFNAVGTFSLEDFVTYNREWDDITVGLDTAYQYQIQTYQTDALCFPSDKPDNSTEQSNSRIGFSSPSVILTIPKRPPNLRILNAQSGNLEFQFGWDDVDNETEYQFQLSENTDFSTLEIDSTHPAGDVDTDYITFITEEQTFYYRVRACNDDGAGNVGCSAFAPDPVGQFMTGLGAPSNLSARIVFASSTQGTADVYLEWDDGKSYDRTILVYRRIFGAVSWSSEIAELTPENCPFSSAPPRKYLDEDVGLGEEYEYKVSFNVLDSDPCGSYSSTGESAPSNFTSVNLDLLYILKGVAWAAQTGPEGVGWIKFNSASEGGSTPSSILYSVQIDKDGLVTGNAWAGEYGWLSFHPEDLVGCESGTCEARFSSDINQFSGWAKFLAPESFTGSSWDGWVHLSSSTDVIASLLTPASSFASLFNMKWPLHTLEIPLLSSLINIAAAYTPSLVDYGVEMGACVGKECPLSGVAWGSEIVGWIGFNEPLPGGTTCVNCTVRAELINEPPTITNVEIIDSDTWCALNPVYEVKWRYSDPDEDMMASAEIRLKNKNTGAVDMVVPFTPSSVTYTEYGEGDLFSHFVNNPLGFDSVEGTYSLDSKISSSTEYEVIVAVSDGFDVTASLPSATFTTPSHYGPYIQDSSITWDPDEPPEGQDVLFDATSTAMVNDRSGLGIKDYMWKFYVANPSEITTTGSSTQVRILSGTVTTTIAITDNLDDEFSFCRVDQSYRFSDEGSIATKRRVFRER
ncbi:MAG TPA: hypothetical protein ENH86_02760 [Candidatus Jorgensenbacteria bacterium]|nr:hypothetical protein [Candidatus Jorgensenbacteria bacterium]